MLGIFRHYDTRCRHVACVSVSFDVCRLEMANLKIFEIIGPCSFWYSGPIDPN